MTTTVSSLAQEVGQIHCSVHQPGETPALTREPVTAVEAYHWRWVDLEPFLQRIAVEIPLEPGGDRRTLGLVNPGLKFGATHTLVAAIQQVRAAKSLCDAERGATRDAAF